MLRYGETAFSVQFHPEFTPPLMRACVMRRAEALRLNGVDVESVVHPLKPAEDALWIMQLFIRQAIEKMKCSVYSANDV
jgi:GMP synthase (glutamine-hydrolysing)